MGDKNRITHDYSDGAFEKLMRDMDTGKIKKTSNWFMDHPAYYGTSIEQRKRETNICKGCVYYSSAAAGLKRACQFPWENEKEYDRVNMKYIPCKGRRRA